MFGLCWASRLSCLRSSNKISRFEDNAMMKNGIADYVLLSDYPLFIADENITDLGLRRAECPWLP